MKKHKQKKSKGAHRQHTVTPEQLAANRENAQKSTGPKTPEGKAKSRLNAVKHGLRSAQARLSNEDEREYFIQTTAIICDLDPQGPLQLKLAQNIANMLWMLDRATNYMESLNMQNDYRDTLHQEISTVTLGIQRLNRSVDRTIDRLCRLQDRVRAGLMSPLDTADLQVVVADVDEHLAHCRAQQPADERDERMMPSEPPSRDPIFPARWSMAEAGLHRQLHQAKLMMRDANSRSRRNHHPASLEDIDPDIRHLADVELGLDPDGHTLLRPSAEPDEAGAPHTRDDLSAAPETRHLPFKFFTSADVPADPADPSGSQEGQRDDHPDASDQNHSA